MTAETNPTEKVEVEEKKEDNREYNFSQLRKQLEASNQRNETLKSELSEIKNLLTQRNSPKEEEEEDTYDDPYIDQKRFQKSMDKFREEMRNEFIQTSEKKTAEALERERQAAFLKQHADFNNTLSEDNVRKFAEKYPEMAEQMLEMPDNFARRKLLYQNIKTLKIDQKEEPKVQEKINQNQKNPLFFTGTGGNAPYSGAGGDFSPAGQKAAYDKIMALKSRLRLG